MTSSKSRYPFQTQNEQNGEITVFINENKSESDTSETEDDLHGKRIVDGMFINMLSAKKPTTGYETLFNHLLIFKRLIQEAKIRKKVTAIEETAFCEMVEMINHFERRKYKLHSLKFGVYSQLLCYFYLCKSFLFLNIQPN